MKIAVIGADGFVGARVAERLVGDPAVRRLRCWIGRRSPLRTIAA